MRWPKKETPVQPVTPAQPVQEVKPEVKEDKIVPITIVTFEQLINSKLDDLMTKVDYLIEGLEKSE